MSTGTNKLKASAFVSNPIIRAVPLSNPPIIRVVPLSSSPLQWEMEGSAEIRLVVHKPVKTPISRKPSSVTVLLIPRKSEIGGWRLKSVMLVQVSRARRESVATIWLEGVAEYGTGAEDDEAISDLVGSLGEYRKALEKRERKLGGSARKELDCLRRLIERSSASSRSR